MDEIRLTVQEPEPINLNTEQIATGPYYLPAVSEEGVISWTNNGGLPNPESRSIEGPQGPRGPQGPAGKDGANGQDGAPGTPGTSAYVWIRYAQQQPTQDSDMSTTPGPWMGVYSGSSVTAPEHYTDYVWNKVKGDMPSVPVTDVQVNGTSILNNGVANVPLASPTAPGVVTSGTITISGSTPAITALPGIQYICGECATLDITLPASGCVDVVFQTGSTPTVLTITPPTGKTLLWANGFDPTSLDANTTYELNIAVVGDQCLGVVGSWT